MPVSSLSPSLWKPGVPDSAESMVADTSRPCAMMRTGSCAPVARLGEEEFTEARARAEHAVLRPLERRRQLRLGQRIGIERHEPVDVGVVDRDPRGVELDAVGMKVLDVLRERTRVLVHDRM